MASVVIGVTGKKRHGKDTFAHRLVTHHGFTRIAFADPLKAVARDLDPIVDAYDDGAGAEEIRLSEVLGQAVDWETAKNLPEVRRILQALGVAVREHVDPEVWANAALRQAQSVDGPVVIPDVRFPNEADLIGELGGDLVRVTRPGMPTGDLHVSETALDDYWLPDHLEISNDGTVANLEAKADAIVQHPEIVWKFRI